MLSCKLFVFSTSPPLLFVNIYVKKNLDLIQKLAIATSIIIGFCICIAIVVMIGPAAAAQLATDC